MKYSSGFKQGTLDAIRLKEDFSILEAKNACIQSIRIIKVLACDFRNRRRFMAAIHFQLNGHDLHPTPYK